MPNVNLIRNDPKKSKNNQSMVVDNCENATLIKLKNSMDLQVAEAERLYYNCDYQLCSQLTEAILKSDPYHDGCLPIHISCQVELKQSNSKYEILYFLYSLFFSICGVLFLKQNRNIRRKEPLDTRIHEF